VPLQWTGHARQRWKERLAEFDPVHEYYLTKVVGKGLKRHIAALCPAHSELMKGFKGFYYLHSPNVIWVMAAPETVVTVWPKPANFKPLPSRREKKRLKRLAEQSGVAAMRPGLSRVPSCGPAPPPSEPLTQETK
jgi:hypothetical protein